MMLRRREVKRSLPSLLSGLVCHPYSSSLIRGGASLTGSFVVRSHRLGPSQLSGPAVVRQSERVLQFSVQDKTGEAWQARLFLGRKGVRGLSGGIRQGTQLCAAMSWQPQPVNGMMAGLIMDPVTGQWGVDSRAFSGQSNVWSRLDSSYASQDRVHSSPDLRQQANWDPMVRQALPGRGRSPPKKMPSPSRRVPSPSRRVPSPPRTGGVQVREDYPSNYDFERGGVPPQRWSDWRGSSKEREFAENARGVESARGRLETFAPPLPPARNQAGILMDVFRADEARKESGFEETTAMKYPGFDENRWRRRLTLLLRSNEEKEIVLTSKNDRKLQQPIREVAAELGLHSHLYERALVVSKSALPHYRPDLDQKRPQRQPNFDEGSLRYVEAIVQDLKRRRWDAERLAVQQTRNGQLMVGQRGGPAWSPNGIPPPVPGVADLGDRWQGESSPGNRALGEADADERMAASSDEERERDAAQQRVRWRSEKMMQRQVAWWDSPAGQRLLEIRRALPAWKERDKFLESVASGQVLVVSGETGCGKTTQLPQYILESEVLAGRGSECNIICTQPRRISAISVAERVAAERGEEIGESVGYQVRLEGARGRQTRLLFCTTGILLRRLMVDSELKGVTHVVVDEIHERGMNEDFLLVILRDLLPRRPDMKVILMSATLNAELFSRYFGNAATLHIPGFTYPVRSHYLEDVLEMTGHVITTDNQIDDYRSSESWKRVRQRQRLQQGRRSLLSGLPESVMDSADFSQYSVRTRDSLACWTGEGVGFNLIETALEHICIRQPEGAVLVFVTGSEEINSLLDQLRENPVLGDPSRVMLLGCHGTMATEEQRLIFNKAPPGVRKIVLATNMAETSITINDVVYVVDCGKAKETSYDAINNVPCLLPQWISKASARQRRGRAGRVQPGVCYHLFPRAVYDAMAEYQQPELLRTPLHSLCLQIKSLGLGSIPDFLGKALQPPEALAVQNAIEMLQLIGALDEREELTPLGKHLAHLPVEPRLGKMLVMGATFRCLGPILTIVAGLTARDPFLCPSDKKELADNARLQFGKARKSDHLLLVEAFTKWQDAMDEGTARDFCFSNFLSMQTMLAIESMRKQFLGQLSSLGFVDKDSGPNFANEYSNDIDLVRSVICAGLFPYVASAQSKAKSTTFKTLEDGQVNLFPRSINAKEANFMFPWAVFNEKVKTTSVFLRDSTGISDTSLLLFGGALERGDEPGHFHTLDGYIEFFSTPRAANLILDLRRELQLLLQRKLEDPKLDVYKESPEVMGAVFQMLRTDMNTGSFTTGRMTAKRKQEESLRARQEARITRGTDDRIGKGVAGGGGGPDEVDIKSMLQMAVHRMGFRKEPRYATVACRGGFMSHVTVGTDSFTGQPCISKKAAERSAASAAWEVVEKQLKEREAVPAKRKAHVPSDPVRKKAIVVASNNGILGGPYMGGASSSAAAARKHRINIGRPIHTSPYIPPYAAATPPPRPQDPYGQWVPR